jgi:hypothetical protein
MQSPYPLADLSLARAIERAEARCNASYVEARAHLEPEVGAEWRDVDGTSAMFDGAGSLLTQSFGFGLFSEASEEQLAAMERFYAERGAEVFHEVSPLAGPVHLELLSRRGYHPVEQTNVLYRPVAPGVRLTGTQATSITVRRIEADEADHWADVAAQGWSGDSPEIGEFVRRMGRVNARSRGSHCFLAEHFGRAVAAGSLYVADGVAILSGASTIPESRRMGAQNALLEARLRYATENGATLAIMGAHPGSPSQRNSERQGFRIAYTRIKWGRQRSGGTSAGSDGS